jgi:DNA sulfur modification protein DndD
LTSLYRKKTLIKDINIDAETLRITLIGASGELLDPERLSAGERQLLATGLIWGLSKSTSRELPTVIDTPVGRLDRQHRKHLVQRYFPKASRQVILLSTDEEIVGAYYTELKPYVGKSYLLDFVEDDIRTSIKEGYFDE